tara:strand:+ start:1568 stop:1756 length:189 start_codon:yes stop_codon:yes gene_type:complete
MTEHIDKVIKRRLELRQERLDKEISFISASDGQITIGYKSGKRITEFDDKRKKPLIEYVQEE